MPPEISPPAMRFRLLLMLCLLALAWTCHAVDDEGPELDTPFPPTSSKLPEDAIAPIPGGTGNTGGNIKPLDGPELEDTPKSKSQKPQDTNKESDLSTTRINFAMDGKPIAVRLRLLNTKGEPLVKDEYRASIAEALAKAPGSAGNLAAGSAFYNGVLADGSFFIRLAKGNYQAEACSGPRNIFWMYGLPIMEAHSEQTADIPSFWPAKLRGKWLIIDPYVDPSPEARPGLTMKSICLEQRCDGIDLMAVRQPYRLEDAKEIFAVPPGIAPAQEAKLRAAGELPGSPFLFADTMPMPDQGQVLLLSAQEIGDAWSGEEGATSTAAFPEKLIQAGDAGLSRIWAKPAPALAFAMVAGPMVEGLDLPSCGMDIWLNLLSMGYRLPGISGGPTGSRLDTVPFFGCYLPRPEAFVSREVLKPILQGQAVMGNGPIITMTVDGVVPGDELPYDPDIMHEMVVDVISSSNPADSMGRVDIMLNREVLNSYPGEVDQRTFRAEISLRLPSKGALIARYHSKKANGIFWAVTNPIYVGGSASQPRPASCKARISAIKDGQPAPCRVAALRGHAQLGSYEVQASGQEIELPAAASLSLLGPNDEPLATVSLYEASGAGFFIKQLEKDLEWRNKLAKQEIYNELRSVLANAEIVFDLDTNAATLPLSEKPAPQGRK